MHLFTIGHSNRSIDDFIALLKQHEIQQLIDVRRMPRSRFNPHFNEKQLQASLAAEGIGYAHLPELGGMRTARADSINTGLREGGGFQGFADYMQTDKFEMVLCMLLKLAEGKKTAFMCAERDPNNCHRQLIADALVAHGHTITHIVTAEETRQHALKEGARVTDGRVTCPAPSPKQLAML